MKHFILLALAVTACMAQENDLESFLDTEVEAGMPCKMKPCQPVCKPVKKVMSFGGFSFPYTAMECGPDLECINANKKCMVMLSGGASKAKAAADEVVKKYNAVKMAHADHKKKKAAAAAALKEKELAKANMDGQQGALRVAEQESVTANAALKSSVKSVKAYEAKMAKALAAYEGAKKKHMEAVAAHDGAKSKAASALAAYNKALKEHCNAEARHAEQVLKLGHPELKTTKCKKSAEEEELDF